MANPIRFEQITAKRNELIEGNSYSYGVLIKKYDRYALFKHSNGMLEAINYVDMILGE